MRALACAFALVLTLTAPAAEFNKVVYSDSGDIVPGEMTCQFAKAKAYADANNIPLVVMWVNPGCGFCENFERSCLRNEEVLAWMKRQKYVFVFCAGAEEGNDNGRGAYSYVYSQGVRAFPMCCVHWKSNTKGDKVDYAFAGRSKEMHESQAKTKLKLGEQFMEVVDMYVGDYVTGIPPTNGSGEDDTPAQQTTTLPEKLTSIPPEAPCGVYQSWTLLPAGLEVKKVKVAGLPSGLKYKDGRIEGAAKSAKAATVKVTLTAVDGKTKKDYQLPLKTTAMPAWATGNFYGYCTVDGTVCGLTLSVKAAGKISGKLTGPAKKTFSENAFASFSNGVYAVTMAIGGKSVRLSLSQEGELGRISGATAGIELEVAQSVWERKGLKPPAFASGKSAPVVTLENGIILKLGAKGKVTIGGTLGSVRMSGSARLVAGFAGGKLSSPAQAVLSVSKKTLPGGYYGAVVDLQLEDTNNDGKIDFAEEKCGECSPQEEL